MHVHRADHGRAAHHVEHAKAHGPAKHADKAERREQRPEAQTDRFEQSGKLPGVVRNLLAGHYKGVAALRLAINHHDKIEAALNGSAQPIVGESLDELAGAVDEQVDALLQAAAPSDEQTEAIQALRDQFQTDLTKLREDFAESPDRAGIEAAVRELTDGLLSEIETVLTPPPPESPDLTTPPDETGEPGEGDAPTETILATLPDQPETTPFTEAPALTDTLTETTAPTEPDLTESPTPEPVDLSALLTTFRDAVDSVLDNLSESLGAIKLPAPPPPSGHGKAYAKFLAMYESLYQPAAPVEPADPLDQPAGIDVTA